MAAVRAGGRLTCGSALRLFGAWTLAEPRLHVAIEPRGRHGNSAQAVFHSARMKSARGPSAGIDSPLEALERLARCATRVGFVVAADSACHQGLVTRAQLDTAIGRSVRLRRLLDSVDERSESGIETIVRLALRGHRVRLRSQVQIERVGRVDLLVGDRLIIEADGFRWHGTREAFEEDRRRDLALAARGYLVVRITYRRVLDDWPAVERELMQLIRRDEHLWRARHPRT